MSTHSAIEDPRNKKILISINGELYSREEAKISVFDSGFLVGDGIWEAMRLKKGVLIFWEEHFSRLWQASAATGIKLLFSQKELLDQVYNVLKSNKMNDGVHVRLMITRGNKKTPSQDPKLTISGPNVVIIPEYKEASLEVRNNGISLFTSTIRRGSPDYLDPKLNCHSKLHEVIALLQAQNAGYDEALMLDIHGFVITCNATNFFMIKNGHVFTSTGQYCMNGITRAKVIEAAKRLEIPIHQCNFSFTDVYDADESFVTGTFGGLTPVREIDGRKIGKFQNKITNQLRGEYEKLIEENIEQQKASL